MIVYGESPLAKSPPASPVSSIAENLPGFIHERMLERTGVSIEGRCSKPESFPLVRQPETATKTSRRILFASAVLRPKRGAASSAPVMVDSAWSSAMGTKAGGHRNPWQPKSKPSRPLVMRTIKGLIVRMTCENSDWGYTRIKGALDNLGHEIGRDDSENPARAQD